jgi:hypothetical protein
MADEIAGTSGGTEVRKSLLEGFEAKNVANKNQGSVEGAPRIPGLRRTRRNGYKSASPIAFYRVLASSTGCMRCASSVVPWQGMRRSSQLTLCKAFITKLEILSRRCLTGGWRRLLSDRIASSIRSDIGTGSVRE